MTLFISPPLAPQVTTPEMVMPSSMFLPAAVADRDVNPSVEEAGKQPGQCDIIPYPCEEK